MKLSIYLSALLLLTLLFVSASCNKDKTPDEDKDWNVLEWTVDGERYKAECEGDPLFGCDPVDCQFYNDIKYLHIRGTDEKTGIIIHKHRNLKLNNQNIFTERDYLKYGGPDGSDTCTAYISDPSLNYQLYIKYLDTINKIIVGNFSFTGIDNCQDTARVKDGYFKLTYRP